MRTALILVFMTFLPINGDRISQVSGAIDFTKQRQTGISGVGVLLSQKLSGSEQLDIVRLNKLIRSVDKTWILPGSGSKEPIGSNFQYKKTCGNIFNARHGACQQLGFGIMCFNYCHEQGEKLIYRCQDASDAAYCKRSSSFDATLMRYKKDSYKAKAFIHQMISRCYATSICNTQTGLLNSSILDTEELLTSRNAASPINMTIAKLKATVANTSTKSSSSLRSRITSTPRSYLTSRVVPIWQKLLIRTTTATTESTRYLSTTDQTEKPEEEDEQKRSSPHAIIDQSGQPESVEEFTSTVREENEESTTETAKTTAAKPSPKRLETTTLESAGAEITSVEESTKEQKPSFWERYQPRKWFQSIEFLANTGKK